jgi:hypothetical protein
MFRGKLRYWLFSYFESDGWKDHVILASNEKDAELLFLTFCKEKELTVDLYVGYKCAFKWFVRKNLTDVFTA